MAEDKKRYNAMESVLQEINKKFVSLTDEDIKRNNTILQSILKLITEKIKQKDTLFKEMFSTVFCGGSFYDGLRVGKPDEFDLDLLLNLPKALEPTITTSNVPGYVHVQFKGYANFMRQKDLVAKYEGIDKLLDTSQYLDTAKVLRWMQSVVDQALNDFEKSNGRVVLETPHGVFYARVCRGGPAFTLKITNGMDVDLVPCFIFGKDKWPANGFKKNPVTKKETYFIVPKPVKDVPGVSTRYWRLSFQEQERLIIESKIALKPALRLVKKLRDTMDHKAIASYYIKTVALWQASEKDVQYWRNSLSYVFMNLLKEYQNCLSVHKITYFWNKNNNLLQNIRSRETVTNLSNNIQRIINDIERHPNDPYVVAKYLLTKPELNELRKNLSDECELLGAEFNNLKIDEASPQAQASSNLLVLGTIKISDTMEGYKRYNGLECYLHDINREYISFSKTQTKRNNKILNEVVQSLITKMKQKDALFKSLYKRQFYGGSYYDGLKVGSPDEYDIDLLLTFPEDYKVEICISNVPGFVHLELNKARELGKFCEIKNNHRIYLDTKKVLQWMEGVIQRALNDFEMKTSKWERFWTTLQRKYQVGNIHVKYVKGGPAFTLKIYDGDEDDDCCQIDVDLVPCFLFKAGKWPESPFKPNPYSNDRLSDFFVVPKHATVFPTCESRYWKLSFQIQERQLIKNKGRLKPALKLLKKMRDSMHSDLIASYFLKTIILWEVEKQDTYFWVKTSLSYVFMHILKSYQQFLSEKQIPYYWNNSFNLVKTTCNDEFLYDLSTRLERIIKDIDKNIHRDPSVIMKHILTPKQYHALLPETEE
ncbi:hypothetical protein NQ315_000863 [Exocentrus adspersus]|uniref:Uncharacterized protein n=1 Tax=Exocentrus adspersus TaxID=1586481 RepID=A0AAV8WEN8_9CUCU|nr:hypothetical protein NQ315_000863 [Exocentrus adspersus]